MATPEYYVGLMSGTSLDGVDAVLVDFSAELSDCIVADSFTAFDDSLRKRLMVLHQTQHNELHEAALIGNELSHRYAQAVHSLLAKIKKQTIKVAAIGCHGQTVRHRPDA